MLCKKCRRENAPLKKCCEGCGAFLEGRTINNITGQIGYRTADGDFIPDAPRADRGVSSENTISDETIVEAVSEALCRVILERMLADIEGGKPAER